MRDIAAKLGRHVAIMGDLQGPKIRVSTFKDGKIYLAIGDKFILDAALGKGEAARSRSASTTRACRRTWYPVTSCCWTMAACN